MDVCRAGAVISATVAVRRSRSDVAGNEACRPRGTGARRVDVLPTGSERAGRARRRRQAACSAGRLVTWSSFHRVCGGRSAPAATPQWWCPNEPPFLRGQVSPMQVRRPGSSPRGGITVAGQRRDLTGLRWAYTAPARVPKRVHVSSQPRPRHRFVPATVAFAHNGAQRRRSRWQLRVRRPNGSPRDPGAGAPRAGCRRADPSAVSPAHTEAAGERVMLNG